MFVHSGLHEVKATTEPKVPEKLIAIEEIQASKNLKFGVLYVKEGQTKEEDMFSNGTVLMSLKIIYFKELFSYRERQRRV